jgi:hypothetical protein
MVQENITETNINQQMNPNDISGGINQLSIDDQNKNVGFTQPQPDINQLPKYNEVPKFNEKLTTPTITTIPDFKINQQPQFNQQNHFQQPMPDVTMDYLNTNTCTSIEFQKVSPKIDSKSADITPKYQSQSFNTKDKMTSSVLAADFKVDTKISKKLDFSLPVKFKDIHYFRLCDSIKKQLDNGMKELSVNKIERALAHAELAYYYLDNINKN